MEILKKRKYIYYSADTHFKPLVFARKWDTTESQDRVPTSCSGATFGYVQYTAHDAATMRETSDSSREKKPLCGPRLQIIRRNVIRCQDRLRGCVANLLTLEYTLYVQRHYLFFFFLSGKIDSDVKSRFLQLAFVAHFLAYFFLSTILSNDILIQILIPIFFLIVKLLLKWQLFPIISIFIYLLIPIYLRSREEIRW